MADTFILRLIEGELRLRPMNWERLKETEKTEVLMPNFEKYLRRKKK